MSLNQLQVSALLPIPPMATTFMIETFEVLETSKVLTFVTQSVSQLSSACRPISRRVCSRVYGWAMYTSGGCGMSLI